MVYTFNFSLTIAVICALVGSSSASLLSKPTVDLATVSSSDNITSPIGPMQTQIPSTLQNLTGTLECMFRRLQQIQIAHNTSMDKISRWKTSAMDLVLRVEMFMIADGSHYAFPLSSNAELGAMYKTIAVAVSKLSRNLRTMKRADTLITEAARELIDESGVTELIKVDENDIEEYFKIILQGYFLYLNSLFADDSKVRDDYKKYKKQSAEAMKFVQQNPKLREPLFYIGNKDPKELPSLSKIESFLQDKVVFRQAVANKLFLKQSVENVLNINNQTVRERFFMASALIRKAAWKDLINDRIDEIYQQALEKAGEVPVNMSSSVIADTLFSTIEKGLERYFRLQWEIRESMQEIEKKTVIVHELDMLRLDV